MRLLNYQIYQVQKIRSSQTEYLCKNLIKDKILSRLAYDTSWHVNTVKPVLSPPPPPPKKIPKLVFNTNYRLMQVKSIAKCSPWSILQYFRPTLSCHVSLRSLFCLLFSGPLR